MTKFRPLRLLVVLFVISFTSTKSNSQATFTGNVFLDQNDDGIQNGTDYGHGVINVLGYEDSDGSGTLNTGDIFIRSALTDQYGDYTLSLDNSTTFSTSSEVLNSVDDAQECFIGGVNTVNIDSADIEISNIGGDTYLAGLRFANPDMPKDAVVTNAWISLRANQSSTVFSSFTIAGELSSTSESFDSVANNITARTTTTATIPWLPTNWTSGDYYNTVNLAPIINELVSQANWDRGAAITLMIYGTGERNFSSFDGVGVSPTLHIDYSMGLTGGDYLIVLDTNSIESTSNISVPETGIYSYPGNSTGASNVNFAFHGENVYCYGLSDLNNDAGLSIMNRLTGENLLVGMTGRNMVESTAMDVKSGRLYAAHLGQVGKVNRMTGVFTDLPNAAGIGDDGAGNLIDFVDLDGMTMDPFNGTMWVSHRIGSAPNWDLLAQIDTTTGLLVTDAFGPGIDYRVIKDAAEMLPHDIDDIAFNPITTELFGIANGNVGYDLLVKIDKTTGVATLIDTIKNSSGNYITDVEGLSFTTQGILSATTGNNSNIYGNAIYNIDPISAEANYVGTYNFNSDYESCDCHTISTNQASGIVYEDADEDQIKDPLETGLANVTIYVYLDLNNDGVIDIGTDPIVDSLETDVDGNWTYNVGSNVDLLFDIDTNDLPVGNTLTTDNLEEALFYNGFGGEDDPQNNFGYFAAPLPVELISFSVKQNECTAELAWESASEEQFAYYQIQRSHDGLTFRDIDLIVGQGGNHAKTYKYIDRLAEAQNFYRLKMVDVDGSIEYSAIEVLSIDCAKFTNIDLFPNPIHVNNGALNLEFYASSGKSKIVVSDILGRPVLQFEENSIALSKNATQIDVSTLQAGTYSLKIDTNRHGKLFVVIE